MIGSTTEMTTVESLEQVTPLGSYLNEINGNSILKSMYHLCRSKLLQ